LATALAPGVDARQAECAGQQLPREAEHDLGSFKRRCSKPEAASGPIRRGLKRLNLATVPSRLKCHEDDMYRQND
jgi:hypothetical protein